VPNVSIPGNETTQPRDTPRHRWVVPAITAAMLATTAAAATACAPTQPTDRETPAAPTTATNTATPTGEPESEQHTHDTMTSDEEREWLGYFERGVDRELIRSSFLEDFAPILAENGYTVDDLKTFAPTFCASVEKAGMVPALLDVSLAPDPDNPGKLRPASDIPTLLTMYSVRLYCPWYVAEYDHAIEIE
jgi:hypothetical protein